MPESDRYQQYEVLRRVDGSLWELGRGAMGITYKAFDTNLRFAVALKVINSAYLQNETARQRFLREARAAAGLRHPNVASVFNLGTDQNNYFYVMEFVEGETLEAVVKRKGRLEPVEALNITQQVARALGAAAKQRLVHRDLKPANLMLVEDEGELVVKVIDFGLAKTAKETTDDSAALTMQGFIGTPHFASPEQVEEGEVDVRSDIYSLGATLYFMLTGKAPFSGSVGQVMSQHLYKPIAVEPLAEVPQCVIALVQNMLEKDRNQRPQTPRELQAAIASCLQEIRGESTAGISEVIEAEPEGLTPGAILARRYRLVEALGEIPQGQHFMAADLRRNRPVRLLILRPELASDPHWFGTLQGALGRVQNAPHLLLRAVYSLETAGDRVIFVEQHVAGPSLQDVLRSRSVLSAPEVVRLAGQLAPLADHAGANSLQYVDFSLLGIYFDTGDPTADQVQPDLLRQPLTDLERLEPRVTGINFSFTPSQVGGTLTDFGTQLQLAASTGPRDSYVRSLTLLIYELLGGQRSQVEITFRYKPIAALTQEGNAVLRRGFVDEFSSATQLVKHLAATVDMRKFAAPLSDSRESRMPEADRAIQQHEQPALADAQTKQPEYPTKDSTFQVPPPEISETPRTRIPIPSLWRFILAIALIAGLTVFGIVGIFIYLQGGPRQEEQSTEIATLSIRTDPPGASILLDGKPPQSPPNTFTHVPFGTHELTATLDNYESIKQDLQVHSGMSPEIHLKLTQNQEIPALSILTDPPGASILLDGKPPQSPNTFTHVPFGTHQLTATLNDYELINQAIEVRKGMAPEIHLKLKPIQEIAALSVQTDPPGAAILLDGKPPQSPNTFAHVPFGTHQLTATLNDYEPIKQDVEVRKGMAPEIRLKLKPIQEIAALSIQTDPTGASILLDGKPPQSPNTFAHVPFGTHQLTATLNDYEPIKQDIEVRKGMAPEIHLKLKPIQEIAALSIQTDPTGASILLDGKPPQSPNTFAHVPFGTHQLTATLNDYEPIKQDVEVRKGMAPEIRLKLKPIQEIAALSVQTDPPGASILLDGKPPQSPNTFAHVPFGTHQLTATLNDYEPIKQDIEVRKGMAPEIRLKLKPAQEIAALTVQTDPTGASILLDGKPPQMPNTFAHVPFGTHQLTATLDKYETINQEIQVTKGMPAEIHVTFKPKSSQLDALVAEAKKYGEGTPEQVTALVRLVQFCTSSKTPDTGEHTDELAGIIEQLRTKTPPISKDVFNIAYRPSIKDAADLNILPAILWLAENEKARESFDLFLRAANLGDSYAMLNVGKRYLFKGTAADDVQAFSWLKRGYESAKPNLEAGAYLGFCYLNGRGTKKDVNEGKRITLLLANQSVVFAMTDAGLLLAEEAQGKREKSEADALEVQARQWWQRAAEKNDWDASARLGLFYQNGLGGLPKSDEQAEKLFREGVKHENSLSKYYYALFLIEKKPDRRSEAENLMSQAATAGRPSAKIWCEQHNVKFNQVAPADEQ